MGKEINKASKETRAVLERIVAQNPNLGEHQIWELANRQGLRASNGQPLSMFTVKSAIRNARAPQATYTTQGNSARDMAVQVIRTMSPQDKFEAIAEICRG